MSVKETVLIVLGLLSVAFAVPIAERPKRQTILFEDDLDYVELQQNQGTKTDELPTQKASARAEDRIRNSPTPHWHPHAPPFSPPWGPLEYPHDKSSKGHNHEKYWDGRPNLEPEYVDASSPFLGHFPTDSSFGHSHPESPGGLDSHYKEAPNTPHHGRLDSSYEEARTPHHGGLNSPYIEARTPHQGDIVFPGPVRRPLGWNGNGNYRGNRKPKSGVWNNYHKRSPAGNNGRPGWNVAGSGNGNNPRPNWIDVGNEASWNTNNRPTWPSWNNGNSQQWNNNGGSLNANNQRPGGSGGNNGAWNGNGNNNGNAWNGNNQGTSWNTNGNNQRPGGVNGAWNGNGNNNGNAWNGNNQGANWNNNGGTWNQRPNANNQGASNWNNGGAWNGNSQRPNNNNSNGAWNGNNQRPDGTVGGAGNGNNNRPNSNNNAAGGNQGWNNFGGNTIDGPSNNRPSTTTTTTNNNNNRPRPAIAISGVREPSTPRPNCNCPATSEFNPVCGTDNVTYGNAARLRCARQCGQAVTMKHLGACAVTTPATPSRRRTG